MRSCLVDVWWMKFEDVRADEFGKVAEESVGGKT